MADIRDQDNQGFGQLCPNSPLARARATSSARMADKINAELGSELVEKNLAANAARKYGVLIFGRLHPQQWDDLSIAAEYAAKMRGEVVEVN